MRRLTVILASTRPNSNGRPVMDWFIGLAAAHGAFDVDGIDLAEVALPFLDEPEQAATGRYQHAHTKAWSAMIERAEAIVWVMPMYNGGFGAAQKNAIDFLYAEWKGKPVGLLSYSGGASGGRPAVEMLIPVLERVGMELAHTSPAIARIDERIDETRRFLPAPEHEHDVRKMLDELDALFRQR